MGWFWSTNSSPAPPPGDTLPPHAPPPPSPPNAAQPQPPVAPSAPASTATKPEDDPEIHKFMAMLAQPASASTATTASTATSNDENDNERAPSALAALRDKLGLASDEPAAPAGPVYVDRERSLADAVLPVEMSCQQAFDMAWDCQSPAGQWRAVYRHGGVRQCSDLWDDFWFCMRVKGYQKGTLKERAVQDHYRKKEMDKYYRPGAPSSEDVWRSRTVDEVLGPADVFQGSFKDVLRRAEEAQSAAAQNADQNADDARHDASQILADAERRRRIREQMGYDK